MPALAPPKSTDLGDELKCYLNADIEDIPDPIAWWHEHCAVYPHLSHMALDYLTIPGESMPPLLYGFVLTCFLSHLQLHQLMSNTCSARDTSFCLMCIHVWWLSLLKHSYASVIGAASTLSRWKTLSRLVPYLMLRMLISKSSRMVGTTLSSYIVFFCSISLYSMLYPQGIPTMGVISLYPSLHSYPQHGYGYISR